MVKVWRGLHSKDLLTHIKMAWENNELLIICPSYQKDFSFLSYFSEVEFVGDWPDLETAKSNLSSSTIINQIPRAVFGIFSSGTMSGKPKLVFYSKENIQASLESIRQLFDIKKIQKIFCYPQPTHTFGFVLGYMQSFLHQIELIALEGAYTKKFHDLWIKNSSQHLLTLGAPAHFIDLIKHVKEHGLTPNESYSCIIGGASVTQELWGEIKNTLKINEPSIGYGATEASPGVTHLPPNEKPKFDGDIGQPLGGVKVQCTDASISFQGKNVCYALIENGQVAHPKAITLNDVIIKHQTHFQFIGRSDLIINRGGVKYSLEAIENKVYSKFSQKVLATSVWDQRLGNEIFLIVQGSHELADDILSFVLNEWNLKLKTENLIFMNVPLNINMKFDRSEAKKIVLKSLDLQFPINVNYLIDFLPHRSSAIWLDEVLSSDLNMAVGKVKLKKTLPYFSKTEELFRSSCIEFVAQTQGYSVIINDLKGLRKSPMGEQAFIIEIKNVDFNSDPKSFFIEEGEELRIETKMIKNFGALQLSEGRVCHNKVELAKLEMKVFVK